MNNNLDPSSVTFGLIIPQRGTLFGLGSLRQLLEQGARAEESGVIDAVWVGDSLTSKSRPEAITCLATLAGMTERVRLAVGCMASFAVRDPALFALQWATLDQASNGRTLLSVCNGFQAGGASEREGQYFGGIPDRERPARLEENIELVRRLWSGEPVDFDGRFTSYRSIELQPRPIQDQPPIWITANPAPGKNTSRVLRRVARLADGYQGYVGGPDSFSLLDELHGYLREFGKDPATFPIAGYHNVNVGSDRDACINDAIRFFDQYYGPGFMSPEAARYGTAAGTVDECVEQLIDVIKTGMTHVPIRIASLHQDPHWDPLVKEIIPAVRDALG